MISYLVNVKVLDDRVEAGVEIIEQVDDLQRRTLRTKGGEADDVTEVDSDAVIRLGHHRLSQDQLTCHRPAAKKNINEREGITFLSE